MNFARVLAAILCLSATVAIAKDRLESCATPESWAASMVQVQLKNVGLLVNDEIDFSRTEVSLLASEKTSNDVYHQVLKTVFIKKNGTRISAVAESDASHEECSMSGVKVYVIEKELGP